MANLTKTVYIEYRSDGVTVTLEAYNRIVQILEESHACSHCGEIFTQVNPCVSLNGCLSCYLAGHSGLTFLGVIEKGQYHDSYGYLDEQGVVYTSYAGNDTASPRRSDYYTLLQWGFTVPRTYTVKGEEKALDTGYWNIYGDFRTADAVVVRWYGSYQKLDLFFILYKDGSSVELNRRSKENKELFKRATLRAESFKDENGFYKVDDYTTTNVESIIYRVVSLIVAEEYRSKIREEKEARVNELVQQWLKGDAQDGILTEIIAFYSQLDDVRNVQRFTRLLQLELAERDNNQQPEQVVA